MSADERYEDCERCGERFVGETAIASYLRDVGNRRECLSCIAADCVDLRRRAELARNVAARGGSYGKVTDMVRALDGEDVTT